MVVDDYKYYLFPDGTICRWKDIAICLVQETAIRKRTMGTVEYYQKSNMWVIMGDKEELEKVRSAFML